MASLGDLFVTVGAKIDGFKQAMRDVTSDLDTTGKKADSVTSAIASKFEGLAGKLTGIGIGAYILSAGKDFQTAEAQISRSTGLIGDKAAGLNSVFRDLYATSSRSAEEIASGLSKLSVETKLTGDALESLTRANMAFAKVTGSDVPAAVEETQRVFKQFNIAAVDQADAMDVLYSVMTETGISLGSLTGQMVAVGPVARAFGMSFVETAALVGAFEEAGLEASESVRGLQMAFAKWAAAGKDPKEALLALIEQMKSAATTADAVNAAIEAGFVRGMAVKMADAARKGALDIEHLTEKLSDSKGKVKQVSDSTDTFAAELTKLGHQAVLSAELIGGPLVGALTVLLEKLNRLTDTSLANGIRAVFAIIGQAAKSAPALPSEPTAVAGSLTKPLPGSGGGAGTTTGTVLDLGKDFSSLHLQDLEAQLASATSAYNELTAAGKLNAGQNILAKQYIEDLTRKLAFLKAGITDETTALSFEDAVVAQMAKNKDSAYQQSIRDEAQRRVSITQWGEQAAAIMATAKPLEDVTGLLLWQLPAWDGLAKGAEFFGITTSKQLSATADKTKQSFELMRDSGNATAHELDVAYTKYVLHVIDLNHDLGYTTDEMYAQEKKSATDALAEIEGKSKQSNERILRDRFDLSRETENMAHRAFDSLEKGLAQNIVQWKNWGDTVKNIGSKLAEDFLAIMLKGLFKPLEDQFAKVASKAGDLLGGLFGGGSSVATEAASGASSAAGGATSIAGSAAGAATSGLAGIVTAVSSAVSAVTGVLSFISGMHQETTLNAIEHNTRYSQINFDIFAFTHFPNYHYETIGKLDLIIGDLETMIDGIGRLAGFTPTPALAAPGGVTFSNCTFSGVGKDTVDTLATEMVRRIRQSDPRRKF